MTDARHEAAAGPEHAPEELARLVWQIENARTELTRLQRDLADAESGISSSQAGQLLRANEQLVLAALRAQEDADTIALALQAVSRSAELDGLTELPNRSLMLDRFEQAISGAKRRGTRLALLFLDINGFKQINDALGHATGDEVLKIVAQCLQSSVRETDTVSRHGGDEFLVLLNGISQAADAAQIADKVAEALGVPRRMDDFELRLTASIGISVYPDDGEDAATLIERADIAMYRAKRLGLGGHAFHGQSIAGESDLDPLPARLLSSHPALHEAEWADGQPWHQQLREANERLVLAALNAQELHLASEQAHRRQTEFLAVMAHELRNPLAPIRTVAALLSRAGIEELPFLRGVIERQVAHMTRLVSDLLDVSRASTGKLRLELESVDMASVIEAAVDACRPAMLLRRQRFEAPAAMGRLEVLGDVVRLTQVVSNLLDNASKYTPNDGDIGLLVQVVGDTLVMTFSDSGIGITAAALPTIFDAFAQDPHAIGFNGVGLGIGLTVVRELVEAHGGTVAAHSAGEGQGSRFVVTLALNRR